VLLLLLLLLKKMPPTHDAPPSAAERNRDLVPVRSLLDMYVRRPAEFDEMNFMNFRHMLREVTRSSATLSDDGIDGGAGLHTISQQGTPRTQVQSNNRAAARTLDPESEVEPTQSASASRRRLGPHRRRAGQGARMNNAWQCGDAGWVRLRTTEAVIGFRRRVPSEIDNSSSDIKQRKFV